MSYTGKITKNITWAMATASAAAKRLGVSNQPETALHAQNIKKTCELLEQLNELIHPIGGNFKISISSVYRSPAVNEAVGGSTTSDHMQGLAADFNSTIYPPELLFKKIRKLYTSKKLTGISQVILELQNNKWIHIAINTKMKTSFLVKEKGKRIRPATKEELGE